MTNRGSSDWKFRSTPGRSRLSGITWNEIRQVALSPEVFSQLDPYIVLLTAVGSLGQIEISIVLKDTDKIVFTRKVDGSTQITYITAFSINKPNEIIRGDLNKYLENLSKADGLRSVESMMKAEFLNSNMSIPERPFYIYSIVMLAFKNVYQ